MGELRDGWRFLRGKPSLYQNTLVSAVAQVSVGATIALTVVYASDVLSQQPVAYPTNYTLIEAAIGVGNLVGGLAVGAIGARFGKGHLFIVGLIAMGGLIAILGLTSNLGLALMASIGYGIANLVYVVPTQTLFAELTPPGHDGPRGRLPGQPRVRCPDAGHGRLRADGRGHPGRHRHRHLRLRDARGWGRGGFPAGHPTLVSRRRAVEVPGPRRARGAEGRHTTAASQRDRAAVPSPAVADSQRRRSSTR